MNCVPTGINILLGGGGYDSDPYFVYACSINGGGRGLFDMSTFISLAAWFYFPPSHLKGRCTILNVEHMSVVLNSEDKN